MTRRATLRRIRTLLLAALMALALSTGLTVGSGPQAPAAAATSTGASCARTDFGNSTSPSRGQAADRRPVVFVHGWTGQPMTATAAKVRKKMHGHVSTFSFDYSHWAAYWASNDHIAPRLAKYVNCVSAAYKKAHGDGRVVLVAHSMGGLAIRYAMARGKVAHPIPASTAQWIITVDTPFLGSPWAGRKSAAQLWEAVKHRVPGIALPNPFGNDGGLCLQQHNKGSPLPAPCDGLPPWLPGGTTLHQVVSTITVRRTFLGIHLYDVPLISDGVVDVSSQRGYLTSGPGGKAPYVTGPHHGTTVHTQRVACTISGGQLDDALHAIAGGLVSRPLIVLAGEGIDWDAMHQLQNGTHDASTMVLDAAALVEAPCSHIHTPTYHATIARIAADLETIAKHAPVPAHRPPTVVSNLEPVTRQGQLANGYTAVDAPASAGSVDCLTGPQASRSAVTASVYDCGPTANLSDACFPGDQPHTVLCLTDPWRKVLTRYPLGHLDLDAGGLVPDHHALPPVTAPKHPQPFALLLNDGTKCRIRDGGSWSQPTEHPTWFGYYTCDQHQAIWGPEHNGINRQHKAWTVWAGSANGTLHKYHVRHAYYVALAK
jgi:pimeloyl-ACP methyl ester carboxylesterase